MTAIAILGGDFEILMDDEKNMDGGSNAVAGMRTVRKAVASPTPVTTNALYSAVAEAADDFIAMGFTNPMLPTTPNAYTMENFYFIPRSTTEFLSEGAITASWGLSASPDTNGNGVLKVAYTGGTNFVATDIGRQVIQADTTDSGTLLDYDIDPDGTLIAWIRPDDSTPTTGDVFDGTGALSVVADGGTGVSTSSTAGISGTTQWAAIQAIGSVPTATEVYLYQNRIKLPSSDGTFQWWTTDPTVSLGIISILVQTISAGEVIADGDVEVFARRYTSLYDNFRLNVSAGGFSALPLASAPDINNTTGYWDGTWNTGTGTAMLVGDVLNNTTGGKTGGAYVVTDVTDSGATGTFTWYEVGDLTPFAEDDTFTSSNRNGTVGAPTAAVGGPTETGAGNGGSVTITLGGFDVDHTGDGTTEPYSIEVDAQGDVAVGVVYERIKYVTRRGADEADLFGAGVNVPGESYRGLDGVFEYDANTSTMTEGDDVATTTGGNTWTGRLIHQNTTNGTGTYITVTDQQTSIDSVIDNNVIFDEAGLGVQDVTVDSGGTVGLQTFTSPKASPLGTFTGTQIFGARGVVFVNPAAGDAQAYILTDDLGTLNNPPNTVSFTVTNTLALDRILVARDTGTNGIINKDQFGGLDTPATTYNGLADLEIRVAGSIDSEVPQSGYVRVVETTLRQEHHYIYDSRTTGTNGVFTLRAVVAGGASTATAGTSTTKLFDSGGGFTSGAVAEVGMLIRNTTAGDEVYEVVSVDSDTELTIVQLYGPAGTFASGNGYTINALIGDHTVPGDYATSDNVYDLILDVEASGTSVTNSFIKSVGANFFVVVNVRQGKVILPFTQNQEQGDGNTTVTVVRQPDTIAT